MGHTGIDEVDREEDVKVTDACVVPERTGALWVHPAEKWFDNPDLIAKYGKEECDHIVSWAKAKAPLDPRTDEPLPTWAIDVLRLGRIGYKGRIRMVMSHAEDILKFRMLHSGFKETK